MCSKKVVLSIALCIVLLVVAGFAVAKVTKDVAIAHCVDKWTIDPGTVWVTEGLTVHMRDVFSVLQYQSDNPRFAGLNYILFDSNTDIFGVGPIHGIFCFVIGKVSVENGVKLIKDDDVVGVWEGTWTMYNHYISPGPYYPSGGKLYIYDGQGNGQGSGAFEGMKINIIMGYDDGGEFAECTKLVE